MISLDNGNSNASSARNSRRDIDRERLHEFWIHIQHMDDQIRGFFCICDGLVFYVTYKCDVREQYIGPFAHFDERLV